MAVKVTLSVCFFTSEYLVDKDFDMVLSELLCRYDDLVEVTLHQWGHDVSGWGVGERGRDRRY